MVYRRADIALQQHRYVIVDSLVPIGTVEMILIDRDVLSFLNLHRLLSNGLGIYHSSAELNHSACLDGAYIF